MYGSVFPFQVKPGRASDVKGMFEEWNTSAEGRVAGVVAVYLCQLDADPDRFVGVAVFEDRETYRANAQSPEQDAWYRRFVDCLISEPEWSDGEFFASRPA